jgi:hypothetical protein
MRGMNTLRGLSQAWLFLAQAHLLRRPRPSQRRMSYTKGSPKPHKAASGRPFTSATENKDQCHHERSSAPASLLQDSKQNPSSRCNIEPAAFEVRAVATPTRRRSQLDGARVKKGRLTKARLQPTHRDLGNDEDLIGPRILYLGAGRKAAHIDIPFTSKRAEYISRFPGNRFSRRKRRRWCGSARRRDSR